MAFQQTQHTAPLNVLCALVLLSMERCEYMHMYMHVYSTIEYHYVLSFTHLVYIYHVQ